MTPLTRLRRYELNRLLQRAGWPTAGTTDTAASPALTAAVLGVSVSTLRRLEIDPWAVSGHALFGILRAVNRLGVPWTPNDFFGLGTDPETVAVGDPNTTSIYEAEDPRSLYPDDDAPQAVGVPYPVSAVSGDEATIFKATENNLASDLTTHTRQE
jgi:transcriptional regulator with XRE-family HTH domain